MANEAYLGVDDVAKKLGKGYLGIDDVARNLKKAYIGDENGLARECFSGGITIGSLLVGSSVFMNVNTLGRTEFLVVHQGLPSSDYDISCDGTWLLMKDILDLTYFRNQTSGYVNMYGSSDIHRANNNFRYLLEDGVQKILKQVRIPYASSGYETSVSTGSNGLSVWAFCLSVAEVDGFADNSYMSTNALKEGEALDYFKGNGKSGRVAHYEGTATSWWLRTPLKNNSNYAFNVDSVGVPGTSLAYAQSGRRPCMIFPPDTLIDENFNIVL